MSQEEMYKDFIKRYDKLYDEMNYYEREKIKYILLACGGGIASLFPFLLAEKKVEMYKEIKTMFLLIFIIGIINIFILRFSQKSLEKALENESEIISLKLKNEISESLENKIRDKNYYRKIIQKLDTLVFITLIFILIIVIKIF